MGATKNALVRTTAVPTLVSTAGSATNVVPAHSAVTIDMRTLPGDDGHAPLQHLLHMLRGAGLQEASDKGHEHGTTRLTWSQVRT